MSHCAVRVRDGGSVWGMDASQRNVSFHKDYYGDIHFVSPIFFFVLANILLTCHFL